MSNRNAPLLSEFAAQHEANEQRDYLLGLAAFGVLVLALAAGMGLAAHGVRALASTVAHS